jgi:hypothetical protein
VPIDRDDGSDAFAKFVFVLESVLLRDCRSTLSLISLRATCCAIGADKVLR